MALKDPRFDTLKVNADAAVAAAIEQAVIEAPDAGLVRVNPLEFAEHRGLEETRTVDGFVHAAKLGLFDISWNMVCPGCGGVLAGDLRPKDIQTEYACRLCAEAIQPSLDESIEVSFTVNPAVRRVAAHDPNSLSIREWYRQLYFNQGIQLPEGAGFPEELDKLTLELEEIAAHDKIILSTQLTAGTYILFEPVSHSALVLETSGEPTRERQELNFTFQPKGSHHGKTQVRPGPLRMVLQNTTDHRVVPALFIAGPEFNAFASRKKRYCTAQQMFSNQSFRDLFGNETLKIDQWLKVTSLTVLFTDLKGSTELYERVGDLAAFELVQAHFRVLAEAVRANRGAVVKTIGDAVMATFPRPENGLAAAISMREAMDRLNADRKHEDLIVKIGLHEGGCLAVSSNERLDYFGQTVNIAARVQGLAEARAILTTEPVVKNAQCAELLSKRGLVPTPQRASLKGIKDAVTVYAIP